MFRDVFGPTILLLGGFVVLVFLFIAPFIALDYFGTKSSCPMYGTEVGYETKFVDNAPYWWSCQVKLPSGWIDYDKINNINLSTLEDL